MKLDKSKPYATITGCDMGRVYEQNDTFFTGDGEVWVEPKAPAKAKDEADAAPKAAAPKGKKPAAKPADKPVAAVGAVKAVKTPVDAQVDDQLKG